jgi:hypothetical protein
VRRHPTSLFERLPHTRIAIAAGQPAEYLVSPLAGYFDALGVEGTANPFLGHLIGMDGVMDEPRPVVVPKVVVRVADICPQAQVRDHGTPIPFVGLRAGMKVGQKRKPPSSPT